MRVGFLLFCVLAFAGCDYFDAADTLNPGSNSPTVFSASFEREADLAGWNGFGVLELYDASPAGGGDRSAYVSGGCPIPHSALTFVAPVDGSLRVEAWAKSLILGGGFALERTSTETTGEQSNDAIGIHVSAQEWAHYKSESTLRVRRGERLQLSMGAGGIVAGAMLVERVEVKLVKD